MSSLASKKQRFDTLRPLSQAAWLAVQKSIDVELTYTSNAIEGNTLTLRETAEWIEHGITSGGKPLRDHLEVLDHYAAVLWMRELAAGGAPLGQAVIRELHRRIVARSQPEIAGMYSPHPRRIAGFSDGNGRTARLLMNLLLLRTGYPPVSISPVDRKSYLDAPGKRILERRSHPFPNLPGTTARSYTG